MRASDFAFFLLTGLDKPAYRTSSLAGKPFQSYMALFKNATVASIARESFTNAFLEKVRCTFQSFYRCLRLVLSRNVTIIEVFKLVVTPLA
jgi:hypothetical protein